MNSVECEGAATGLVRDLLQRKEGETVLVDGGLGAETGLGRATVDAVEARGGVPLEVWYRIKGPPGTEPPAPMAEAMRKADVLVEFARTYLITTRAFQRAMDGGTRHLCLTGMDGDMMTRCIGNVSLPALKASGLALQKMTAKAKEIRVTSPAGTDLTFQIGKRPLILDAGECVIPGRDCYLGGQISWAAVEPTIRGTLVLDGALVGLLAGPMQLMRNTYFAVIKRLLLVGLALLPAGKMPALRQRAPPAPGSHPRGPPAHAPPAGVLPPGSARARSSRRGPPAPGPPAPGPHVRPGDHRRPAGYECAVRGCRGHSAAPTGTFGPASFPVPGLHKRGSPTGRRSDHGVGADP